jgi:GNAT superfamily N-acetyltransferase
MAELHDDNGQKRVRFSEGDGMACVRGCEIYAFEVLSGRGKGTGTSLLGKVEKHMRDNGCRTARYYATPLDVHFWTKHGYCRCSTGWFRRKSWWMTKNLT